MMLLMTMYCKAISAVKKIDVLVMRVNDCCPHTLAKLLGLRFCRAILCISAAYAVMRCLCVCHVREFCRNK